MKLEVVVLPVSDVDRAKRFYQSLGWQLDADFAGEGGFRVVQLTPQGSSCSLISGTGVISAVPGTAEGLQLVDTDIDAARAEVAACGVDVSDVFHDAGESSTTQELSDGRLARRRNTKLRLVCLVQRSRRQRLVYPRGHCAPSGAVGADRCCLRRASATAVREPPSPVSLQRGGIRVATTYNSAADLAAALRPAADAHGRHEAEIGHSDPDWPHWYAHYMVQEQAGGSSEGSPGART